MFNKCENIVIGLYVDVFLITGTPDKLNWFTNMIKRKFNIAESVDVDEFIGVQFYWKREKVEIILHQQRIINKLLDIIENDIKEIRTHETTSTPGIIIDKTEEMDHRMSKNDQDNYRLVVGNFLYIISHSIPDISNSVR